MLKIKKHKNILLDCFLLIWLCLSSLTVNAQSFYSDYFSSTNSSCKTSCGNSTCQLTTNANGILTERCPSGTRYDVDPNCIMNQNAQPESCIDTMPVSSIKRATVIELMVPVEILTQEIMQELTILQLRGL